MLTSPKLAFILTILFLALSACGGLESAKIDVKKSTVNTALNSQSQSEFALACTNAQGGGRLSANGTTCLTRQIMPLTNPDTAQTTGQGINLVIDQAFASGKFIVATAGPTSVANSVDILYDGRAYAKVPARMPGNLTGLAANRPLTFYINSPNYRDVSVTIWSCYTGNISNRVPCTDAMIP